jgi:S-DNA-T family DNA segregation ATPase FtsK/SpoIIIE
MAKKKKRGPGRPRKEEVKAEKEPNLFLRQVYAVLLIVFAVLILMGGFGWGGNLPIKLFEATAWLFGVAAYIVPLVLIYLAVHKFKHEEYKIPFKRLFFSVIVLLGLSGMFHVFVDPQLASSVAAEGKNGGHVGALIASTLLMFLNNITAFIVLLLVTLIALIYAFDGSLRQIFEKLANRPKKEEDTDMKQLKEKEHQFQLHEGVPTVHHQKGESLRAPLAAASLKNRGTKLSANEDHAALTAVNDPNWKFPPINLLNQKQDKADPGNVESNAEIIHDSLSNFNIAVEMEGANVGPRVTQYMLKPSNGVKMSKIVGLSDNIAYDLAATSIRIEAPIPGKRAVGIEVPNLKSATVTVSSILSSKEWAGSNSKLSFAIGKDITGNPVIGRLDKMPHVLIAGQTGSGKSVMINSLLASFVYRNSPSDLKLILVDPKQVELTPYNNIPHLLTPVITDPEKCISALKWAVAEMERRLRTMAEVGKRNIGEYNSLKKEEGMPYIVIVIDELADLMMMAARDVEALVVRLAQKARAAGIHLVLATQRPSVDVITGLIKANVPARIAFTVNSQVDSRTIIDMVGADKLLGMGDMLFLDNGMMKPIRVQGAFIDDNETMRVNDFLREQQEPKYDDEVVSMPVQLNGKGGIVAGSDTGPSNSDDDMFKDAVRVVLENRKASTSLLQRRLRIGYGRASRIIDEMEERGVIGPADGARPREVLIRSLDDVFREDGDESVTHIEVSDDPRDEYLTN